ncbi:MAG: hypothetical protein JWR37_6149, partial [Mycobacterium sp.]|nr:hypothetical protein [Mycobacterium sp.]
MTGLGGNVPRAGCGLRAGAGAAAALGASSLGKAWAGLRGRTQGTTTDQNMQPLNFAS